MATPALPHAREHFQEVKRWLFRARPRTRRLKLVETLALGDRRFVAILSVNGRELLVGATPQTVALLGELPSEANEFDATITFGAATGIQ